MQFCDELEVLVVSGPTGAEPEARVSAMEHVVGVGETGSMCSSSQVGLGLAAPAPFVGHELDYCAGEGVPVVSMHGHDQGRAASSFAGHVAPRGTA